MSARTVFGLAVALLLGWLGHALATTVWPIVLGACVPAAVYAVAIVFLQRGAARPAAALVLAFVWGALGAAPLSTILNALGREWIGDITGAEHARAWTAMLVAPAIEEAAKALGLVLLVALRPTAVRSVRDGIVYGALIGVGFVCSESLLYLGYAVLQAGEGGLARAVYTRGLLFGPTHAVFSALVGAAIGWSRSGAFDAHAATDSLRCRRNAFARAVLAAMLGLTLAVAQHAAWNSVAAELIDQALCGAQAVGGACRDVPSAYALFGWAPLWSAVFLAPGCAALWVAGHHTRRIGASTQADTTGP